MLKLPNRLRSRATSSSADIGGPDSIGPFRPFDPRDLLPAPGLICAYLFGPDGLAVAWPEDQPLELTPREGWLWAHFNLADSRAHAWLAGQVSLSREAREALSSPDEHAHLREDGTGLSGMFADLVRNLRGPTEEIGHLHFVLNRRLLLTARRKSLQGADATRTAVENGLAVSGPAALLESVISRAADGFDELVERLTGDLDRVEDRVLMEAITDERQRLGRVRHTSVRLQRPLTGLRRMLRRLNRHPDQHEIDHAVLVQRLETLEHDLAVVQDRARLLQDEINAKIAAETNRQLFALSVLTAIFIPATLVTGLFGMNLEGMPFASSQSGFWWGLGISLLASLAVCVVLWRSGVLQRRGRW